MTAELAASLGPLGIWSDLNALPMTEVLRFAMTVEELGAGALWINEGQGREPFALLGALARSTRGIQLGLGIASIYARDPLAAHAGARTIAELSGGRFVMGLGVSHRSSVEARGHEYHRPLSAMRRYLDAYEATPWTVPAGKDAPLVLAALGPRMLSLAAERAAGAFVFLVSAEMVAMARRTLDEAGTAAGRREGPILVASMHAMLGTRASTLDVARTVIARYVRQPNYRANLLRAGADEGSIHRLSEQLVRSIVAVGDADDLRARLAALHAAGADHVVAIPLSPEGRHANLATARALLRASSGDP